jgi:hypothetical protein
MINIDYTNNLQTTLRFVDKSKIIVLANVIVDKSVEHRIDIISKLAYNDISKAYAILIYNDMYDAGYIPEGTIIKIPDFQSFIDNTEYVEYKVKHIDSTQPNVGANLAPNKKVVKRRNYTRNNDNGIFIF